MNQWKYLNKNIKKKLWTKLKQVKHKNLWNAVKVMLGGNLIALNTYTRKDIKSINKQSPKETREIRTS